jgi:polar amino acid transport system permease protein
MLLGVPVAVARNAHRPALRIAGISYVELLRGIPPIAWLFVAYYGLVQFGIRISPMAAAIGGLGLISGAYIAEIYRAGLRAVPHGQWEAARAVGLSELHVYRHVVAPQAAATIFPPAATYLIGLLKDTAVASVIGAAEITAHALSEQQQTARGLSVFAAAAIVYLALSLPLGALSRAVDRGLRRRLLAA